MNLRNIAVLIAGVSIFGITLLHPVETRAGVNVNIGINLPAFLFPEPPSVVVIPGTYVYFAPEADVDVFFYHGYWYRPYGERWFRAGSYNGPWGVISPRRVPSAFLHLPPDYRHAHRGYKPVPYGQLKKHWRTWERDRHWEKEAARTRDRERYEERGPRDHSERGHDNHRGHGKGMGKHD